jgi:hypothetical protein
LFPALYTARPGDDRQLATADGHIAQGKGCILTAKSPAGQLELLGNGHRFFNTGHLAQVKRVQRLPAALQTDNGFTRVVGNVRLPALGFDLGHDVVNFERGGFGMHNDNHEFTWVVERRRVGELEEWQGVLFARSILPFRQLSNLPSLRLSFSLLGGAWWPSGKSQAF